MPYGIDLPDIPVVSDALPYVGPLKNLWKLGSNINSGDWLSSILQLPSLISGVGTVAGTGALGAGASTLAPALASVGWLAAPAAAAAFFAGNDSRKDAERRANELHEYGTARRDLPTTMQQAQEAMNAHEGLGDDLSGLSDDQLRGYTGSTQGGLLSQAARSHALMQIGAGEDFAGIKGRDISGPQALAQNATPFMAKDYMREADEFGRRGLTLGGDARTASHGSIYDPAAQQQALNAPDPADMLKSLGKEYGLSDDQINALLDSHRISTAEGGAKEVFNIPNWTPGHYLSSFEDWMKHPDSTAPAARYPVYTGDTSGQFTGGGA